MDNIFTTSAIPIAVAAWLFQRWLSMVLKRREQSLLAVCYLKELRREIATGVKRLRALYCGNKVHEGTYRPIMPVDNWLGVRDTIPDDVFRRICSVAEKKGGMERIDDLRWHLKNYYCVICKYGNELILEEAGVAFEKKVVREHLDGAKMLLGLIDEVKGMMEENSRRHIWPH